MQELTSWNSYFSRESLSKNELTCKIAVARIYGSWQLAVSSWHLRQLAPGYGLLVYFATNTFYPDYLKQPILTLDLSCKRIHQDQDTAC